MVVLRRGPRVSVVLSAETIGINDLFRSKTMTIGELVGQRRRAGKGGARTMLIAKSSSGNLIRGLLPNDLPYDDFFKQWLARIPDLDAMDKERRRAEGKLRWWES